MSSKAKFTCKYGTTDFLTARNYHTWKHDIMDFLASDDALEITLGTEEAPHGKATALARDYRKRSGRAFGMIRSSTDPEVRLFVNSLEHRDPARLWVALREKYDIAIVNTLEDVGNVANMAEVLADSNPTPKRQAESDLKCFYCLKEGHRERDCPLRLDAANYRKERLDERTGMAATALVSTDEHESEDEYGRYTVLQGL